MRLFLVRHGQTTYNRDGLGLGRTDAPLTDLGIEQARRIGEFFASKRVDAVFSSPLSRAAHVAQQVDKSVEPQLTEALIELDAGETEGIPFTDMREKYADFLKTWGGPEGHTVTMPGGESLADVDARVGPFLGALAEGGASSIVLVSHNFVVRAILCRLLGIPLSGFRSFAVDLASISIVDFDGQQATVSRLNGTCHLKGLES